MLKVTRVAENDKTVTLKLEGRIVGEWIDMLERECKVCLGKRSKLILDLSAVGFVDKRGVEMLKAVQGDRVRLTGCSLFLSELLRRGER
ncbi:STAS domain-containing protein [Candidatus Manganitrophus noduliformans]|uniref:STAS domain-containing protein n=1 Tax=Candidatus Manganitrophus noduliformans TaxID=2606439 RepID=A0A7X6IAA1_9BACT|nr:STAS domain-containing protein [Candidatus Manganitrophus noduliformans]NKE70281.1 STAS domain-containing protein [Candidatus Manganitrophus noduliformans]